MLLKRLKNLSTLLKSGKRNYMSTVSNTSYGSGSGYGSGVIVLQA
jgi:hypothetical protein